MSKRLHRNSSYHSSPISLVQTHSRGQTEIENQKQQSLAKDLKSESESEVAQSSLTVIPWIVAHGIFQARVLEWVAISFSKVCDF